MQMNRLFFSGQERLSEEMLQRKLDTFAKGFAELEKNEYKIFTDHPVYDDVTVVLVELDEVAGEE